MKTSSDFKRIALNSLKDRWGISVGVGAVATLLGATGVSFGSSSSININFPFGSDSSTVVSGSEEMINSEITPSVIMLIIGIFAAVFAVAYIIGLVTALFSCIIEAGHCSFNLDLVDGNEVTFGQLFSGFKNWGKIVLSSLLTILYTSLWSLLFIIPGIIAGYNYAMVPYLLAEEPELGVSEILKKSKQMMYGNRWRLFCLNLSFIGWNFLGALSAGVGYLWIVPYQKAAIAAFYREVSGTEKIIKEPALATAESAE